MANKRLKSLQKLQQFDAQLGPEFQNDYKAMHDKVLSLIPLYTKSVQLCLEMYTDYETQQNQIKELQTEINESKAHFHTLARHAADEKEKANAQIHKLKTNYQRLQNTHNTLQNTHNTLQNTHNTMCNEYSKAHKKRADH